MVVKNFFLLSWCSHLKKKKKNFCILSLQVYKTYKDMCALKKYMDENIGCDGVIGCIYVRYQTTVSWTVKVYANSLGIKIMREGVIDADKLAELVDDELENHFTTETYTCNICGPHLSLPSFTVQPTLMRILDCAFQWCKLHPQVRVYSGEVVLTSTFCPHWSKVVSLNHLSSF